MAEAQGHGAAMEFGPCKETLDTELLHVLASGDEARMADLLSRDEGRGHGHSQVAISVDGTTGASSLLGVTTNGNTALHVAATRGHAALAALICARAPALAATRNRFLDTPLHCAAKSGHREVAACLLSKMRAGGSAAAAALRATNCLGATALYEAVRSGHAGMVGLLMAEAPELACVCVANDGGVSPLYLAATIGSVDIVRALLRPLPDGTPSPASAAGPDGRTALHSAATTSKGMTNTRASCLQTSILFYFPKRFFRFVTCQYFHYVLNDVYPNIRFNLCVVNWLILWQFLIRNRSRNTGVEARGSNSANQSGFVRENTSSLLCITQ
jgi:hypothetical protein